MCSFLIYPYIFEVCKWLPTYLNKSCYLSKKKNPESFQGLFFGEWTIGLFANFSLSLSLSLSPASWKPKMINPHPKAPSVLKHNCIIEKIWWKDDIAIYMQHTQVEFLLRSDRTKCLILKVIYLNITYNILLRRSEFNYIRTLIILKDDN